MYNCAPDLALTRAAQTNRKQGRTGEAPAHTARRRQNQDASNRCTPCHKHHAEKLYDFAGNHCGLTTQSNQKLALFGFSQSALIQTG